MKKLAIVLAVGTAALMGSSVAIAADNRVKAKASTDVTKTSTDISSRHRHGHWRGHHHHHHRWGHRHHRPYYNSCGYAPRPYGGYYGRPGYYGGGPGVTFSFGSGGYCWVGQARKRKTEKPAAMRAFCLSCVRQVLQFLGRS